MPYVIRRAPDSRTTASKMPACASSRFTMPARGQGFTGFASAFARPAEALEQAQLGGAVGLEGAVELEVLVAQIGQDRDVVGDSAHAFEREAVRRRLDDGEGVPGLDHGPQRGLELGRLRGRHVLAIGGALGPDLELHRAEQAGRAAGCLERGGGERGRRALAVRARDPDHAQLAARVAVPPGCGVGEGRARALDHQLRQRVGDVVLDDRGCGTAGSGGVDEVMTVDVLAADGDEQRSGLDRPTVLGHAADRDRPERSGPDRAAIAARAAEQAVRVEPAISPESGRSLTGHLAGRSGGHARGRVPADTGAAG